jgi:hypothetical protein
LVIAWHLLSEPDARYCDLGPGYYAARIDSERRKHHHIRQRESLGYTVTSSQPPDPPAPVTRLP